MEDWLSLTDHRASACVLSFFFSGSETALTATSRARMLRAGARPAIARAGIVSQSARSARAHDRRDADSATTSSTSRPPRSRPACCCRWFGDVGVLYATVVMTVLIVVVHRGPAEDHRDQRSRTGIALAVARPICMAGAAVRAGPDRRSRRWCASSCGCSASSSATDQAVLSAHEEIRGAGRPAASAKAAWRSTTATCSAALLDLRDLDGVRRHGPPHRDDDGQRRRSAGGGRARGADGRVHPHSAVARHAGEHRRHPARQGSAARDPATPTAISPRSTSWRSRCRRGSCRTSGRCPSSSRRSAAARPTSRWWSTSTARSKGLVTLEDILEEIVGDISDEHDVPVPGVRPQPDGSVNVDGAVPIRDLNRAMDWNLPDDEATTVAGLVIHEARSIPDVGQSFTFHGFRFNVLRKHAQPHHRAAHHAAGAKAALPMARRKLSSGRRPIAARHAALTCAGRPRLIVPPKPRKSPGGTP